MELGSEVLLEFNDKRPRDWWAVRAVVGFSAGVFVATLFYALCLSSIHFVHLHLDNCSWVILPSNIHVGRMPFFKQHPARRPHAVWLTYFLATAQESKQREARATKVFNRKKMAYSWVVTNVSLQAPLKWFPARRPLVICPKNKPFFAETLKAEQQRLCRQSMSCAHRNSKW